MGRTFESNKAYTVQEIASFASTALRPGQRFVMRGLDDGRLVYVDTTGLPEHQAAAADKVREAAAAAGFPERAAAQSDEGSPATALSFDAFTAEQHLALWGQICLSLDADVSGF